MKITLFTSNNRRHNYLINLLSEVSNELFVIQECQTILPVPSYYNSSPIMNKYFENVFNAQIQLFGNSYINNKKNNTKILSIPSGDLNYCSMSFLKEFLKSDIYIVYGSSYIKGELADFLIKQKAINIHAGLSPYYKGSGCNFWALYDDNPNLVGATIHLLSKQIDGGPILYHAMSNLKDNPYEYTMSVVKSAFLSLFERINNRSIFKIQSTIQDKSKVIRYSKKDDFNEKIVKKYFEKEIDLNKSNFKNLLLKDPFFLNS